MVLSFKTNRYLGIYLIFILIIGYLATHLIGGRFNLYDFEVYYRAAGRILQGQNLYRIQEDGHYLFKYSPVSALYFIPFRCLPLTAAKALYWICSPLAVCFVLILFYRIGSGKGEGLAPGRQNLLYLVSFITLGAFLELEITLGQVNIFLLLLLLVSAVCAWREKPVLAGLFLSVSLFLKPFGLILVFYYLYRGKWKDVLYVILFVMMLSLLPLLFYRSLDMFLEQYHMWGQEILTELGNKQHLLEPRNHTLFSVLARYTPLRWVDWTPGLTKIFQVVVVLIIAGLLILPDRGGKIRKTSLSGDLGLILCLVPLLAYTNRNLYIFNGLASAVLLIRFGGLQLIYRVLFVIGILISSFNIIEIWGERITSRLEDWSFITIGTMIIWVVLYINTFRIREA